MARRGLTARAGAARSRRPRWDTNRKAHPQPRAAEQNAFLALHSWEEYAEWHLGLTEGAPDRAKARYAFAYPTG
jgi:hypothetical protein